MRESPISEAVNIIFDCAGIDFALNGSFLKHLRVMNSLGPTQNFLTSHEKVVRAGISWVVIANCGVEGTSTDWVAMEHIEISIILLPNYFS